MNNLNIEDMIVYVKNQNLKRFGIENLKRFGIENGKFTGEKYNAFWYWITPETNNCLPVYLIMSFEEYSKEEILEKVRLNFPDLYRRLPTNIDGSICIDESIYRHSYDELFDRLWVWDDIFIIERTILFIGKNGEEYLNGYYYENK